MNIAIYVFLFFVMKNKAPNVSINGLLKHTSARRWHSPECYISNDYSRTIKSNPFAQSLLRTHHESGSTRFPNGSLIPLVPIKRDGEFQLELQDTVNVNDIVAPSYILGNQRVLKTVEIRKMWHRYISLKFKTKNGDRAVYNTKPMPGISDIYRKKLETRIISELAYRKFVDSDEGIQMISRGQLIDFSSSVIKICLPNIENDVFIPYLGNEELCYNILRLMRYYL